MTTTERDQLIVRHLRLVTRIAGDFQAGARAAGVPWEDVIAAGSLGLVRAADRWRPERGRFASYSRKWIRGSIRRELGLRLPFTTGLDLRQVADHRAPALPLLEPMFPVTSYVPESRCPHSGPMPRGSVFICAVCNTTAYEGHELLELTASDRNLLFGDDRPGRGRRLPIELPKLSETRRQRRLKIFGADSISSRQAAS